MSSTTGACRQSDCTPCPPRRKDLSWRYATAGDIAAISYTITTGRWKSIQDLKARALRVLRFFASLNRTGSAGYRGTRCCLDALAAGIRRATEEAGSKRTVQRALKELVDAGYLTYKTANGRFRQIGPDDWRPEQICIYTLTDKAISIWSHTSLPMTNCRGDDQKNPEIKSQSLTRARSCLIPEKETETKSPQKAIPCVLKLPIVPPRSTTVETPEPVRKNEQRGGSEGKTKSPAPKLSAPKNAKNAILECLKLLLLKRGRQGKVTLGRAVLELSGRGIVGEAQSGVNWDYWVHRWFTLTRTEQTKMARSEILPSLLNSAKGLPPTRLFPTRSPSKRAETHPSRYTPERREPTEAETIRNLRALENGCLGRELSSKIARLLAIENFDE